MEFIKFLYPPFDGCADLVYPGCWMGKVDLTDGFFHRKAVEFSRKYLGLKLPETGEHEVWLDRATIQFRFLRHCRTYTGNFCVFGPVLSSPAHGSPSLPMAQI
jgi:hypothetical protein